MDEQTNYRIVISGELSRNWMGWFDNFDIKVSREPDGAAITTLSGPVTDQAALRGILCKLWDLNLTLISAHRLEAGGEEKNHE